MHERACVIGYPVTPFPLAADPRLLAGEHGIDGDYERAEVAPERVRRAFSPSFAETGFVGGNVTVPHKEAAFALSPSVATRSRRRSARSTRSGSRTAA